MKIRSPMTDRTIYRQRTDPSTSRSTIRRLGTLVLALVLVLLLMQRAGDPEVYRKLFGKLGIPVASSDGVPLQTEPRFLPATPKQDATSESFERIIGMLRDEDVDRLTRRLATLRHASTEASAITSDSTTTDESKDKDADSIDGGLVGLGATLASAAREVGYADPTALEIAITQTPSETNSRSDDQLLLKLQAALDKAYFKTVEDGTVWNSGDFKALYRTLQRVDDRALSDDPVYVGVVPLIEQSVIYRGRRVRTSGQVVRITMVDAQPNPFNVQSYAMVWLRPIDGSERPLVVCTPRLAPQVAAAEIDHSSLEGPLVDVDGLFLKRYLYRSVGGYEQAPMLIGDIRLAMGRPSKAADRPSPVSRSFLNGVVLVSAAIGVLMTGIVYWTSQRNERFQRKLRQKRPQPSSEFLENLD
ncbi:MAG: hypothetical protein R3C05_09690 [Pirellulaceae bacterium]